MKCPRSAGLELPWANFDFIIYLYRLYGFIFVKGTVRPTVVRHSGFGQTQDQVEIHLIWRHKLGAHWALETWKKGKHTYLWGTCWTQHSRSMKKTKSFSPLLPVLRTALAVITVSFFCPATVKPAAGSSDTACITTNDGKGLLSRSALDTSHFVVYPASESVTSLSFSFLYRPYISHSCTMPLSDSVQSLYEVLDNYKEYVQLSSGSNSAL